MTRRIVFLAAALAATCVSTPALAADWPTFRHDVGRSGVTEEKLPLPLVEAWVFASPYKPRPAYGPGFPHVTNWEGGVEKRRIDFDRCDSVVTAGGYVFFGSVGDGKVYCLDPATAAVKWTYATGGPVRLAPAVASGKVYVGSDDGYVYCLSAADGREVWKFRAAPDDLHVIGNGSVVSLWPVRTGVLVDGGVAYFGAGIFPTEGVFLYAVDAATGRLIWRNDTGGEMKLAEISPQGYLLANDTRLVVPMGRLCPGIYDRKTGRMLLRLSIYYGGGTFAALRGDLLYTGWESAHCFRISQELPTHSGTTATLAGFPGGQLVAAPGAVYSCGLPKSAGAAKAVMAYKWIPPVEVASEEDRRKGKAPGITPPAEMWTHGLANAESIILAGDTLFVGAHGEVHALSAADGKTVWSAKVDGQALSLTASDGRLYVSTDTGKIYCFAGQGARRVGNVTAPKQDAPVAAVYQQAAERIAELAPDARKGFAVVYGIETGELAIELARRTELKVYAVDPDAKKAAEARKRIDAAGLYGGRVVVRQWPLEKLPCTQYFANLVVSETALATGKPVGSAAEMFRIVAPVRGKVILGRGDGFSTDAVKQWAAGTPLADARIVSDGGMWAVFTRPPLKGARPWTHQYGTAGNTGSSDDELVRAPLRVQWWGDPGAEDYVDRHYWGAAPLAYEGRLFVCSYKAVSAYDAYNGTLLWTYPLPDAVRAHLADVPGNIAIGPDGYFVAVEETCYRFDPATGALLGKYLVPPAEDGRKRMWGYVAYQDGVLVGSRTLGRLAMDKWRTSKGEELAYWLLSDVLFGMDARTGRVLWQYKTEWFRHNSVAAGDDAVYLSHPDGAPDAAQQAVAETRPLVENFPDKAKAAAMKAMAKPSVERLAALDLRTGKPRWQRPVDWSFCGGDRGTLIYKDGLLLQMSDVGSCKAFNGYPLKDLADCGPAVAARDAKTGRMVWYRPLAYRSRAVVAGQTLYAEPWAYDLKTAEQKMVANPVTGRKTPWLFFRPEKHCGPFTASAHTLFFRCGGFGYADVDRDEGTAGFDSNRPNCWTSYISAEGLALWPTSDSGCRCAFAHECSLALVHDDESRVFADYTTTDPLTPVKHLALNLGAPGDRRADDGRLWLGYPRRKFVSAIELPIQAEFHEGGCFTRRDSSWNPIAGTKTPWVYTSAAVGIKSLTVPVRAKADGAGRYVARLHFVAPAGDSPGARTFDVKVQGKVVAKGLDVVQQTGAADKAWVVGSDAFEAGETITIELICPQAKPTDAQWPILCGLEILDAAFAGQ